MLLTSVRGEAKGFDCVADLWVSTDLLKNFKPTVIRFLNNSLTTEEITNQSQNSTL